MSLAWMPHPTSLLRDENWDYLAENAESRGGNVLQFDLKQRNRKTVTYESRIAEVRLKTGVGCGEKRLDKINCDAKQFDLKTTTWRGETVSPASPVISPRRRPNGTYKNFPSLWAAFWLLVGLVKSGR